MLKEINQTEYKENIEGKEKGLYLLVFHALWCPPCKMFKTSLEELNKMDGIPVYRIDVDQNTQFTHEMGVSSMPTWFIIKNSKVMEKVTGYIPYEQLKAKVMEYK
ncbi:thioredoxin family protein [Mycoplasmopsis caviae]|uniref:Thioredoxin n=1 Tax=Mycoplasmopsis caviae TaxID=55603 RepID=A0A3P8MDH1_9BACT|nr:thioredoxin family protein [Mycoplasmopsis caviae]UUD35399.1 thioredoxin family protein [Mycoplasmopsis caviae]UUD35402.1 thioredoxin family protein [Mycoplasmopsis caviae]VDR41820.1 Thioredoxin [Mycoplasmopsis caviae]VDR41824.1 Thioredoxin [Mycoplasmopsis caviae]